MTDSPAPRARGRGNWGHGSTRTRTIELTELGKAEANRQQAIRHREAITEEMHRKREHTEQHRGAH